MARKLEKHAFNMWMTGHAYSGDDYDEVKTVYCSEFTDALCEGVSTMDLLMVAVAFVPQARVGAWLGERLAVGAFAKGTSTAAASSASKFGGLAHASAGVAPYSTQRALTAGKGGSIQAHHLIEKRFADVMGGNTDDWATVVVTRAEHQVFTNAWRQAIPYGAGTRNATRADVQRAARQIYADYPEILKGLGLG